MSDITPIAAAELRKQGAALLKERSSALLQELRKVDKNATFGQEELAVAALRTLEALGVKLPAKGTAERQKLLGVLKAAGNASAMRQALEGKGVKSASASLLDEA